jgi:hypothetical protein
VSEIFGYQPNFGVTNYRERDPPIPGVSLTTFKRNGRGVPAPMWIGRDGADLRFPNNPRVLMAPSTRFDKVRDGVFPSTG